MDASAQAKPRRTAAHRTLARLRYNDRIAEEEAKFENLIFNIPGIVYRCEFNSGWTMEYISESVRNVTGYPRHEFTDGTRDYGSIMVEEDRSRVDEEVSAALEADEAFYLEYRIRRADGEERWVGSRGRGVRAASGALRYLDGAIFDISEEKRIQAELERHREELAHSIDELKRIDELRTRMFQNVSHELRTPLALILAPTQRLFAHASESDKRSLSSVMRNSYRLLDQINALLDVAKMDATGLLVHPQPVDLRRFLTNLTADVRPAADEREIELHLHIDAPDAYDLDPQHMERVVLNLLSNALKFTPAGGAIHVNAHSTDRGLEVRVRDTGPGIAKSAQATIFDRFVQADDNDTVGGTGIGLALVLDLTKRMGGEVHLESALGEGATFLVHFPFSLRSRSQSVSPKSQVTVGLTMMAGMSRRARYEALRGARAGKIQHHGAHGPRVLVVEDNVEMNAEISAILAAKFRVTSVYSGLQALDSLSEVCPAAIVSDVSMPGMDGVELARRLRERPDFREVGIILLSAHADLDDRIRGLQVGVDAYLTKPFHPDELAAAVEGILRSRLHLVGDFHIHQSLGTGGQGSVFLAESRAGNFVALKLISAGSLMNPLNQQRLARELEVLQHLEHPNIVRIVKDGSRGDVAYVAMEFLDGANLEEILQVNGVFNDAQVRTVLLGLCRGVQAVHQGGILHRDLKCENAMMLRCGPRDSSALKIVDFGLASESTPANRAPANGTLPYQAPELRTFGEASTASDIYALGVIAFRLCSGTFPITADALPDDCIHAEWVRCALLGDPKDRIYLEDVLNFLESMNVSPSLPNIPATPGATDLAITE
ncbi:MAG: PAS domain S-box-containing protein [Polyangiales bacterium]